ncbi:MAG: glutamate mutase L [Candidatus Celaenobacter antarcticus]|nr:glutamate mutase L [Candidatus Celaenobacter antarcticus]
MINKKNILITDVGSTTTKAVLFQKDSDSYKLVALKNVGTTVERPQEDVKIGIFDSIRQIEKATGIKLFDKESTPQNLHFNNETIYLTTSSAGGGLQILVFGLTLFDSASSAKRAAYGSGGVILDTFAINDNRTPVEKMQLIRLLRPDIILFSGGTDGGNISSIVRMGELLSLAHPKPKFGDKTKIPLVYAGNKDAQSFIGSLFSDKFQLCIVPNIRPTLKDENLPPAQQKIHQLFMDNVMEQAPGYDSLKKVVSDDIIPTPSGVINALRLVSKEMDKDIISVDIGGATTDVFSNIIGKYYRTVSANYGMSYSISNVMKDTSFKKIQRWLPADIDEHYIRNYIANKMLYPLYIPKDDIQVAIEHAVAREAIRMSKKHHMKMHFNTQKIGFLDKLKHMDLDKFLECFYVEKLEEQRSFHMKDIGIMIGAGGVFSNAPSSIHALITICDGLNPEGVTEIWRDNHFISPHLGKLSEVDNELASELLQKECYQKIGICVRPIYKNMKPDQKVMEIQIGIEYYVILSNSIKYFSNEENTAHKILIKLEKGFSFGNSEHEFELNTELPILVDTRFRENTSFEQYNKELNLFEIEKSETDLEECFSSYLENKQINEGTFTIKRELPYSGEIFVKKDEEVKPFTLIGENKYAPPKIYVLSLFTMDYLDLNPELMKKSMLVREGDSVKFNQRIIEITERGLMSAFSGKSGKYQTPVRGKIEHINFETGTIILREIQDYSTKPLTINIAKELKITPKHIKGYLKKREGDFVETYEPLASRLERDFSHVIPSPATGVITAIDTEKGTMTIQYKNEPYRVFANVSGKVIDVVENLSATIQYKGIKLNGIIGFGGEKTSGIHIINESYLEKDSKYHEKILVCFDKISYPFLKDCAECDVAGVIAPSIDNKDLVEFLGEEIGVALTGNENIPFPIILTEGFGDFRMNAVFENFFKEQQHKMIYMNGHTQIRAGVVRPQMIVFE